jgi:hypothetical protein
VRIVLPGFDAPQGGLQVEDFGRGELIPAGAMRRTESPLIAGAQPRESRRLERLLRHADEPTAETQNPRTGLPGALRVMAWGQGGLDQQKTGAKSGNIERHSTLNRIV